MASSGAWRVRRRSTGADDGAWTMNALSLGEGPQTLAARPFVGRRGKRRKLVDVKTTLGAGGPSTDAASSMFGEVVLEAEEEGNTETDPLGEYAGPALLCFLNPETFIGVVDVEAPACAANEAPTTSAARLQLKIHGAQTAKECTRELCGANDCCGDQAYLISVQVVNSRRKRTFAASQQGIGDYAAFRGRGLHYETDLVPGGSYREQAPHSPPRHRPLPHCAHARTTARAADAEPPLWDAAAVGKARLRPLPWPDDRPLARPRRC